jgi:phosphoribosylformimino-5-aminoimidazole carboxamide ribotide isomerase
MIVVPAIDIRSGRVVRLKQGRLQDEQVYGAEPAEVARRFATEGAERLHVVDLDAAIEDEPQPAAVEAVLRAVRIPVEVGGGIRSLEMAERYRQAGADRVIFGTAALTDPELVQQALARHPEAVVVALDARDGYVSLSGWKEISQLRAVELALRVKAWGVARVQYTDTKRDGMLVGPNLVATSELALETGLRITAAGGITTLDDLAALRDCSPLVDEAVVGKALYERRFTIGEARYRLSGS